MKENSPKELNFLVEGRNAEQAERDFKQFKSAAVKIPRIHWKHSSTRILTMDFMEGIPLRDVAALRAAGIDLKVVSKKISEIFCAQIFLHGFVHCDPHPGNILVSQTPNGKVDIILLDHGLYRSYTDEFRLSYAQLWRALILADIPEIIRCSELMNAGDMYSLFAGMLTRKQWEDISKPGLDHLDIDDSPSAKEEIQYWASEYSDQITDILAKVPRPLILLLKTNDCLKAVDDMLGTPVNTSIIMARFVTKAINAERCKVGNVVSLGCASCRCCPC